MNGAEGNEGSEDGSRADQDCQYNYRDPNHEDPDHHDGSDGHDSEIHEGEGQGAWRERDQWWNQYH